MEASANAQRAAFNQAGDFWSIYKLEQNRLINEKKEQARQAQQVSRSLVDLLVNDIRREAHI
jgi:hypothetical protein